jgi:hypothetical protein
MKDMFENPFTWLFIALGMVGVAYNLAGNDAKISVAKEQTKQMEIQFRIDSLKVGK